VKCSNPRDAFSEYVSRSASLSRSARPAAHAAPEGVEFAPGGLAHLVKGIELGAQLTKEIRPRRPCLERARLPSISAIFLSQTAPPLSGTPLVGRRSPGA
jgi:hypothetical protein